MLRLLGLAACCGRSGATTGELERQSTDAFVAAATLVGEKQARCAVRCTYSLCVDHGKGRALGLVDPMATSPTSTRFDKPSSNDETARSVGLCEQTCDLTQSAGNTSCGFYCEQPSGDHCQGSLGSIYTAGRSQVPSSMAGVGMGSSMLSAGGGTSGTRNAGTPGACVDALGGPSGTLLTQLLEDESSHEAGSEQDTRAASVRTNAGTRAALAEPLTPDPSCGPLANLDGPSCSAASATCSPSQLATSCRQSTNNGTHIIAQQQRAVHAPPQALREFLAPQLLTAAGIGPSGSTIHTISSWTGSHLETLAASASARRDSLHTPSDASHTTASWAPGEAGGARTVGAKAQAQADCPGGGLAGGASSGAGCASASAASVPCVQVAGLSRVNSSVHGSTGPAPQPLRVLGPIVQMASAGLATDSPPAESMVARWMAGQTAATPAHAGSGHRGARAHGASDLQSWAAAAGGAEPWAPGSTAEVSRSCSGERVAKAGWVPAMMPSSECSATSTVPSWMVAASTARPRMPSGGVVHSAPLLHAGALTDGGCKLPAWQQMYPGGGRADVAAAARGGEQAGDMTANNNNDSGAHMATVAAAGWATVGAGGPGPPPAPTLPSAASPTASLAVPLRYNRAGSRALAHASRHMSQVALMQMLHTPPELPAASVQLAQLPTLHVSSLSREIRALRWIGQGGGGAVFQGVWQGATVAVKFMLADSAANVDAAALEGVVSSAVNHPNVVHTYTFEVTRLTEASFVKRGSHPADDTTSSIDSTVGLDRTQDLTETLLDSKAHGNAPEGGHSNGSCTVTGLSRLGVAAPQARSPRDEAEGLAAVRYVAEDGSLGRRSTLGSGGAAAPCSHPSDLLPTGCGNQQGAVGITGSVPRDEVGAAGAAMYSGVAELACKDAVEAAACEAYGGGTGPVVPVVALPAYSSARASGTCRQLRLQQPSAVGHTAVPLLHANLGSPDSPERLAGLESSFQSDEGFGDPDLASNRLAMSVRVVLEHLRARPGMYMTHIVMEYCDRGSLLAAICRGIFRMEGPPAVQRSTQPQAAVHHGQGQAALMAGAVLAAPPSLGPRPVAKAPEQALPFAGVGHGARFSHRIVLRAVLRTARDVAQGMHHLHSRGIIHGDLKPGNVLLRGCRADRRGFVAMVADFGLAKVARGEHDRPLEAHHWSTVTIMAPEVILGQWHTASDVFSFGILLWQLLTSEPVPYRHLTVPQVLMGVAHGTLRPEWPPGAHPALVKLGRACLDASPGKRPSFEAIVKVLVKIEKDLRDELKEQRQAQAAAQGQGQRASGGRARGAARADAAAVAGGSGDAAPAAAPRPVASSPPTTQQS